MNITNPHSNLTPSRNEKSLPKSMYHVFDKAMAKRENLRGGLSEHSTNIYFPYTPAATTF